MCLGRRTRSRGQMLAHDIAHLGNCSGLSAFHKIPDGRDDEQQFIPAGTPIDHHDIEIAHADLCQDVFRRRLGALQHALHRREGHGRHVCQQILQIRHERPGRIVLHSLELIVCRAGIAFRLQAGTL